MVVAVTSVDTCPFLVFSDLTCHLDDGNRCSLVSLGCLILRRPNLEVAAKRLFHEKVIIQE